MTTQINFTKAEINKLSTPEKGIIYYKDSKEKGLSLYITTNHIITFFIRKRINGKDERVLIGNFPDITIENARKQAKIIKGQIAQGINPNEEKNELRQEITFGDLFKEYIERYAKKQKVTWKDDERDIKRLCSHWFKKRISTISNQDVRAFHEKLGGNTPYMANRMLAKIQVMYNKAIEWGYGGKNPANNIKKFKERSRDRFIQTDELPRFFEALAREENKVIKDYIYFSLYTGARRSNILTVKWEQINFEILEWRIPKTKNGDPQSIPLIEQAIELLQKRKKENEKLDLEDFQKQWIFPSINSKAGHLADPKRAWSRILDTAKIKDLRLHDIRRTLGSYQAITGASLPIIGKSLGHKSTQATQIYSRLNNDPVRQSMSKAIGLMGSYEKK